MVTGQQLHFNVRIGRTGRVHRFQVASVEDVERQLIATERGPDCDRSESRSCRFAHRHPLESVEVNQFSAVGSVQLQQSPDVVDQFVPFFACSVDGVWTVETEKLKKTVLLTFAQNGRELAYKVAHEIRWRSHSRRE